MMGSMSRLAMNALLRTALLNSVEATVQTLRHGMNADLLIGRGDAYEDVMKGRLGDSNT